MLAVSGHLHVLLHGRLVRSARDGVCLVSSTNLQPKPHQHPEEDQGSPVRTSRSWTGCPLLLFNRWVIGAFE